MKKKTYLKPEIECLQIEPVRILDTSPQYGISSSAQGKFSEENQYEEMDGGDAF